MDSDAKIKNIPHSTLPKFHGLSKEDLDTFIFEFDALYRSYAYVIYAQKLKIFPILLKDETLHWLMGVGCNPNWPSFW